MRKIVLSLLCASILSTNLITFASEQSPIRLSINNVPLKSPLQSKYSAYRIDYINESMNPVRVNDVRCYNRVAMADMSDASVKLNKHDVMMFALSPLTLGITGLIAGSKATKQSYQIYPAMNEAKQFNAMDYTGLDTGNALRTSNEILAQGQSLQFNILVPINETPNIIGNFEDTNTHKYIRIEK